MSISRYVLFALLAGSLLAALIIVAGCRSTLPGKSGRHRTSVASKSPTNTVVCPIDGLPSTPDAVDRRPLAVMIENSPQARPQSGLTQACVVYEALTEGGITRFMAIYLHGAPPVIGPVRSVRPHFIYLAQEYDPVLVHCGESYEALQILATAPPVYDLDQLKYAKPFWRDQTRRAPHNLYASTERLRKFIAAKHWTGMAMSLPNFSNGGAFTEGTPAPEVNIYFGGAVHYHLKLVYDAKVGGYLRYMDGKLHVDKETGKPIVVKNVVIERTAMAPYPDSKLHTYDVSVIGSGDGYFVSEGKQTPLRWQKISSAARTQYTDLNGRPLPFQPGQTWIEIVPDSGKVTISPSPPA